MEDIDTREKPFEPFYYNGKEVIGKEDLTKGQYWKIFGFLWAWTAVAVYLTFLGLFCPIMINGEVFLACPYLTVATQWPVIIVSIFTFLWTYNVRKQENRKNYIYETKE